MKKLTEVRLIVYICFIEIAILLGLGINKPTLVLVLFGFLQGLFLYIIFEILVLDNK